MNKIYKILILGLVLSVIIQTGSALKEGQDYTCIDKVDTKTLLPAISVNIDKSIEKTPLCSEGKVPKTIIGDIDKDINELQNVNISIPATAICSFGICRDIAYSYQNAGNLGVRAYLTQHNPGIDSIKGIHSKASIETGDFSGNGVQTGWRKTKGDVTRLSTAWWKNNVFQCYNECGWQQISNYIYPGMPISSNDNGIDYEVIHCPDFICADDISFAGWYVYWNGELLGYYPDSLWDNQFETGDYVKYQGEVVNYAPVTTTDMGNGLWASNPYAAKIYSQQYLYDEFNFKNANTVKYTTSPNLYSVMATSSNSMRYGGPGGTTSITVVSPNGGEKWAIGTSKTIKWSYAGNPGNYVKIELLKNGIFNKVISSSTLNDGSYSWYIPSYQPLGSDYKIRITSMSNSAYKDTSNNNFIISNPYITVISPNGGENWGRGTTHTISWKKDGNVGSYVKIQLYKSGILKSTINSYTPNDGSYSWTVPSAQTLGSDYKIKITSTSNSAYYDWSNNYFRIY